MDAVSKVFTAVKRENFMPEQIRDQAHIDSALPIGYGQTISQPTTVEMMLRWLEIEPGNKVLDIGSGSGWTTALLSHLIGPKGEVYAVEKVPELVDFGRDNCTRAGVKNAQFFQAGDKLGLPQRAPFDRILVSAAATKFPDELLDQLQDGGKLVVPVNYDILEVEKINGQIETIKHPGFVFVPLIH